MQSRKCFESRSPFTKEGRWAKTSCSRYSTARRVAAYVSKNGTFILNIPGRANGAIDAKEMAVLDKITDWMQVNSEAIYETRPWKISGEGPNVVKSGSFQGNSVRSLSVKDIRFTRNKANTVLYAIALGWPTEAMLIRSLGKSATTQPGKISNVQLVGTDVKVAFGNRCRTVYEWNCRGGISRSRTSPRR